MTTVTTPDDEQMVGARCYRCDDEHPLGDRPMGEVTTCCPHCGDTRYESVVHNKTHIKPDTERIADVVRGIDGVGEGTLENILESFPTYYDFVGAEEEALLKVDGVGQQIAERIKERR